MSPTSRAELLPASVWQLWIPCAVFLAHAWTLRAYTCDYAYISLRYARNWASGQGLVFNRGAFVEGFANFLWTILAGVAIRLHLDPLVFAKTLGCASGIAIFYFTYEITRRLWPKSLAPAFATWLLASSTVLATQAINGMETTFFIALLLGGIWRLDAELANAAWLPFSAIFGAAAALTRPEGIACAGAAVGLTVPSDRWTERQGKLRIAGVAVPFLAFLVWRYSYYDHWFPIALSARLSDWSANRAYGRDYAFEYLARYYCLLFPLVGIGTYVAYRRARQTAIALGATAAVVLGSVLIFGPDGSALYRLLAPAEPILYIWIGLGIAWAWQQRGTRIGLALIAVAVISGVIRIEEALADHEVVTRDTRAWDEMDRPISEWLLAHEKPDLLAIADFGYVGYRTGFPIYDMVGLVDSFVAGLPGGFNNKPGNEMVERFVRVQPHYAVFIATDASCSNSDFPNMQQIMHDRLHPFESRYRLVYSEKAGSSAYWCLFERSLVSRIGDHAVFEGVGRGKGWRTEGDAFTGRHPYRLGRGSVHTVDSSNNPLVDRAVGTLISPPFAIDRDHLSLMVAGGSSPQTRAELWIGGKAVLQASGQDSDIPHLVIWNVSPWQGRQAHFRFVDESTARGGYLRVDEISLFDLGKGDEIPVPAERAVTGHP